MKKYYSEICETIHKDALVEFKLGLISEAEMREFDEICLVEEPETVYESEKSMTIEHVIA